MKDRRSESNSSACPSRQICPLLSIFLGLAIAALTSTVAWGQNTYPHLPPELNRVPDQNQANDINNRQAKNKNFEAANAARKKQINDDTAKLIKLTADLKSEVDKTGQDTLSLGVIRRADEIEKLAHDIKEKMKLTVGGS